MMFSRIKLTQKDTFLALLLCLGLLAPISTMLFFMQEAIKSEQVSRVVQLENLYMSNIKLQVKHWQKQWDDRITQAQEYTETYSPAQAFKKIIELPNIYSAQIFNAQQKLTYPNQRTFPKITKNSQHLQGEQYEFTHSNFEEAIVHYKKSLTQKIQPTSRSALYIAIARCYLKQKKYTESETYYNKVTTQNQQGTHFWIEAQLGRLNVLIENKNNVEAHKIINDISIALNDYRSVEMNSRQRLFAMSETSRLAKALDREVKWPTLEAERYAHNPNHKPDIVTIRSLNKLFSLQIKATEFNITLNKILEKSPETKHLKIIVSIDLITTSSDLRIGSIGLPYPLDESTVYIQWKSETEKVNASKTAHSRYVIIAIASFILLLVCTVIVGRFIWQVNRMGRLKLDLLSTVSHELKTPLASTRLLLDNMQVSHSMEKADIDEYIDIISKENHRLISIVNNFLTFSKIENHSLPIRLSINYLSTLVNTALDRTLPLQQQTHTKIFLAIEDDTDDRVSIDHDLSQIMLINLIENAIKYNSYPIHIHISVSSTASTLTLKIKDNGIGMTETQQKKIFQRYYRAENTLARQTQGSGLGLSIVAWASQRQKIAITVDSLPDKGSTFSLTFKRSTQ